MAAITETTLEVPYPPSINHYYRRAGVRMIISKEGREYRERVCTLLRAHAVPEWVGPLSMTVELYPPDRRRRDLDNAQKALWDALQHGGLYQDDSQIKHFEGYMHEAMPPHGLAIVKVRSYESASLSTRGC